MTNKRPGQLLDRNRLEQDTLRLLCSAMNQEIRVQVCRMLSSDCFADLLRRTIFEEICALGAIGRAALQSLLPARLTNRGFPDVDFQELFAASSAHPPKPPMELFGSALQLLCISREAHAGH
jgi:hypothetical protein